MPSEERCSPQPPEGSAGRAAPGAPRELSPRLCPPLPEALQAGAWPRDAWAGPGGPSYLPGSDPTPS